MARNKPETPEQGSLLPSSPLTTETASVEVGNVSASAYGAAPSPELVASVAAVGILVPILVQATASGPFRLLAGRRRLQAAKAAGMDRIPAVIVPADAENTEALTLKENMTRRPNPVTEYLAIKSLLDRGFTSGEITTGLGIKKAILDQRLRLSALIPDLFSLLETGKIGASVGEAAAKLPESAQQALLELFAENGDRLTLKDVAEARRARKAEKSGSLADLLFGGGEKAKADARTCLSHLDAAEVLLKSLGEKVDFEKLRVRLGELVG